MTLHALSYGTLRTMKRLAVLLVAVVIAGAGVEVAACGGEFAPRVDDAGCAVPTQTEDCVVCSLDDGQVARVVCGP